MPKEREPIFTIEEVTEAFDGLIEPEAAVELLHRYAERKKAEEAETARMQRMVDIIDEFDEVWLLEREGDRLMKPDSILHTAKSYLYFLRNQEIVDELDEKARLLSLYILATLDGPYSGGEELEEELEYQPISGLQVKLLMKQYVVEKFGSDAWRPEFDSMEFIDLFMYQNIPYFDGESFTEILHEQPLISEIRAELDRRGYALKKGM